MNQCVKVFIHVLETDLKLVSDSYSWFSDSDSQFRIRKSNTKLENLKVILWYFKEN